jgi:two-component system nitrogen regulation response regulator GlnG
MNNRVLVADDDNAIRLVLQQALTREGYQVRATSSVSTLSKWAQEGEGDLIVTDVYMGEACVFDALPAIRAVRPTLPVIVMSAQSTVATAMSAANAGAYDYLPKPFDLEELVRMARRALQQQPSAKQRAAAAAAERDARLPMVGRSAAMQEVYRAMARAAATDLLVLIEGETGVGKERIARAIHQHSRRAGASFAAAHVAGDSAGLSERLERLAAHAVGGALYLEGVDDLDAAGQAALLMLVEGLERSRNDVRLMVGARRPLRALVEAGLFRADLFYRLDLLRIAAPPLRDRPDDIGEIARALMAQAKLDGLPEKSLDPSALERLQRHDWPGNVRELWNLLRRLSIMRPDRVLTAADVEAELTPAASLRALGEPEQGFDALLAARIEQELNAPSEPSGLYDRLIGMVEKPLIEQTLRATRGNQIKCAAILGINRNTLRKKIVALGVTTGKGD